MFFVLLIRPLLQVGLPAKSGVSGGILLVVPNVMGIMCWSPPLDKLGNSVRGIQFCTVGNGEKKVPMLGQEDVGESSGVPGMTEGFLLLSPFQDLVELFNFHNYDNLRHFAKKYDPRREGGEQRVSAAMTV